MKADILRIYKSIHTWTGILCGMALFIAFYAGALTVFKAPLTQWASPPAQHEAVPLANAEALIARTLAARPEVARDFSLQLQEASASSARLVWRVAGKNADEHDSAGVRHYEARLDADGMATAEERHPLRLGEFIDTLHRVVGLPVDNDPNRWFMGVVSLLYALALVSGVILVSPTLVRDFLALRVGKNIKRLLLDAHNVVGIVSLPFHLVMALTAVVFAFHDEIYLVQNRFLYDGNLPAIMQGARKPSDGGAARNPADMLAPQELIARVRAIAPGFEPDSLQYLQVTGARAVVRVWGKDSGAIQPRARGGFAAIDPYSGKILSQDFLPGRQSTAALVVSSFFALHMAAFGGTAVQWMYFVLGLGGAWLFYSGNLLWIESRRRKAQVSGEASLPQRRDVRVMAALTVGICLGCVCGISAMLVVTKWLVHAGMAPDGWYAPIYYAIFFACIGWSFLKGEDRASVHLLYLAAVLALAIPVSTAVLPSASDLARLFAGDIRYFGVDLTALVGAFGLARMAAALSRKRSRSVLPGGEGRRSGDTCSRSPAGSSISH